MHFLSLKENVFLKFKMLQFALSPALLGTHKSLLHSNLYPDSRSSNAFKKIISITHHKSKPSYRCKLINVTTTGKTRSFHHLRLFLFISKQKFYAPSTTPFVFRILCQLILNLFHNLHLYLTQPSFHSLPSFSSTHSFVQSIPISLRLRHTSFLFYTP